MRKIITILCTLIFTINLSANAAMISVNEDSLLFSESKEETEIRDKKIYEEIYANNEIENQGLTSNSKIEKTDDSINLKKLNTSVMYTVRVKNGEVYEFTNNSDEYINLEFIIGDQDVSYDYYNNGMSVTFDSKEKSHRIYSNCKITFSVSKGEYLDILVPYEFKDSLKRLSTPLFQKIEIEKGKSYEFKSNYTRLYVRDESDQFIYDYTVYNNNGDHINTVIGRENGFNSIDTCTYRIAINNKSNMEKLEFYVPYEKRIDVKILDKPLIRTIVLNNKNNYEIVNKMNKKYNIVLDSEYAINGIEYEYVSYDKNNYINYIREEQLYNNIIECDGKIRVSLVSGNNLTLYVPYDFQYEINYINTPILFRMDILPNKTYEINNSYLHLNSSYEDKEIEFDVIQYRENGEIDSVVHSSLKNYIPVFPHIDGVTKIRLTNGEKLELILPYENRNNITETNQLLLKKILLEKNKEYQINNNNLFDILIDIDGWGGNFDFEGYKVTYYDSIGEVKETAYIEYGDIKIKANESVKVSINIDGYNIYVPYEATIVDDDSESDSEKPMVGDFNNDGKVDILDVSILAMKYNKQKSEADWDSTYDLNNDFIIDIFDLSIVAKKL